MRDVRVIIVPLRLLRALLGDDHTPPTVAARVCDKSSFITLPFYVLIIKRCDIIRRPRYFTSLLYIFHISHIFYVF